MLSGLKNYIITFCVSVLIFGLIAYFVVNAVNAVIADSESTVTTDSAGGIIESPDDTLPSGQVTEAYGSSFTVLFVGTDYQSVFRDYDVSALNRGNDGLPIEARKINADSILVVRVDTKTQTYLFTSVPSNTRVLADGAYTTLGSLYTSKGMDYLCRAVQGLTGFGIDYYACVSVENFAKIIDTVGGVYFSVPTDMYYFDRKENEKAPIIDLKAGNRTLTGAEAAAMLRYVSYTDGNQSRMSLSVSFAQAVLRKITDASYLTKLDGAFFQISSLMETNVTAKDITSHADVIAAYASFKTVTIPYPGSALTSDGETLFEPSVEEAIQTFRAYRR